MDFVVLEGTRPIQPRHEQAVAEFKAAHPHAGEPVYLTVDTIAEFVQRAVR